MQDSLRALAARAAASDGQALVEYTLVLGLITVVAMGTLGLVGGSVNGVLTALEGVLSAVPGA
jgi:Flp pilus assembly pilin Flp